MKKRIILSFILICVLFNLTGCGNDNNINGYNQDVTYRALDHKVYKYMKVSSNISSSLMYNIDNLFGGVYYVTYYDPSTEEDIKYSPELLLEFDTKTGHGIKATLYIFFNESGGELDQGEKRYYEQALDKFNSKSEEARKDFKILESKMFNDNNTSYIKAEVNPESNNFYQYVSSYLMYQQDIEKYKNEVFYSRLDNYYDPKPQAVEGDNFFEEPLESTRIEWSDKEIKPF